MYTRWGAPYSCPLILGSITPQEAGRMKKTGPSPGKDSPPDLAAITPATSAINKHGLEPEWGKLRAEA